MNNFWSFLNYDINRGFGIIKYNHECLEGESLATIVTNAFMDPILSVIMADLWGGSVDYIRKKIPDTIIGSQSTRDFHLRPIFIAGRLEKKGKNIIITLNIFNIKGVDTLSRRSEIFKPKLKTPEYEDELLKNWIYKQPYNLHKYFMKIDCPYILGEDGLVNKNIKASPCYSTSKGSYTLFYSKARDLTDYIIKLRSGLIDDKDNRDIWYLLDENVLKKRKSISFNNTTYPLFHPKAPQDGGLTGVAAGVTNPAETNEGHILGKYLDVLAKGLNFYGGNNKYYAMTNY